MNPIIIIIVAIARKGQLDHEPMGDVGANPGTGMGWLEKRKLDCKGSTFNLP